MDEILSILENRTIPKETDSLVDQIWTAHVTNKEICRKCFVKYWSYALLFYPSGLTEGERSTFHTMIQHVTGVKEWTPL